MVVDMIFNWKRICKFAALRVVEKSAGFPHDSMYSAILKK